MVAARSPGSPTSHEGPRVRLWLNGAKEPERNFASLLDEPYDMELMKYYVTGQLAVIDVKTHIVKKVGAPAMISSVDASPDANYFRVTIMQEPFSYVVQYGSFGTVDELWDASGKVVAEIQKRPLREGQEPDTTAGGGRGGRGSDAKRDLAWMPQGHGMYYIESEPSARRNGGDTTDAAPPSGGRGGAAVARKDRLVEWLPPYGKSDTKVLYAASAQMSGVLFSDDAKTIFVTDNNNGTGDLYAVNLADTASKHTIVRQRGYVPSFAGGRAGRGGAGGGRGGAANDSLAFYRNPGAMLSRRGIAGRRSGDGIHRRQGRLPHWHAVLAGFPGQPAACLRGPVRHWHRHEDPRVRRAHECRRDACRAAWTMISIAPS